MQCPGPAALLGQKFRTGRAFCEARAKDARLIPASRKLSQCITYWLPGFVRFLKDASGDRYCAHQVSCGVYLDSVLCLEETFSSLLPGFAGLACEHDVYRYAYLTAAAVRDVACILPISAISSHFPVPIRLTAAVLLLGF